MPVNFQSVMDRPERVSRVTPPSTIKLNTQPVHTPSHAAIALRAPGSSPLAIKSPPFCS